jgi:hypothetical protein
MYRKGDTGGGKKGGLGGGRKGDTGGSRNEDIALIKKKIKISPSIRKFRMEQLQSHI